MAGLCSCGHDSVMHTDGFDYRSGETVTVCYAEGCPCREFAPKDHDPRPR